MSVEIPTREEWEAEASSCDECENPLSLRGKPCWKHKIQYMQLSGASGIGDRSHTHRVGEQPLRRPELNNSWEKGYARDDRGVRILTSSGRPFRMKEFTENRRHIEGEIRKNRAPGS